MNNYDDIINLEYPFKLKHPRMTIYQRSAQFAPFAALIGYNEAIIETARLTNKKIEIDEGLKAFLDYKLQEISVKDEIIITYFEPDFKKKGGSYKEIKGKIKKIDEINKIIIINDKKIKLDDIININKIEN